MISNFFHKTNRLSKITLAVVLFSLGSQQPYANASINSASIMTSSVSPNCADYSVVGICFWLKCSYFKCSVKTSAKVHHFIPEMVVSVYNHNEQSPWKEVSFMNIGAVHGGQYENPSRGYTQYRNKNGEAIGHPGGIALQAISSMGYSCQSQTTPFIPHFLSGLDFFMWGTGVPEMFYPEAFTPGMREVGQSMDMWGNLYPRTGNVTQVHDYKAAAVVAQRIADIVSRRGQLHVYNPATRTGGQGNWYPKEVKEGDKKTHRWQLLSPKMERSCSVFPNGSPGENYSDKISTKGDYSWALWRPYACCKKEGQVFLGNTDWKSTHTQ